MKRGYPLPRRKAHSAPAFTSVSACVSAILAAAAQAPAHADEGADIQEVIVTATRRAESVLEVPYNISAVSGADLQASGVTDLQDLTHMVPGLAGPDLGPRAGDFNNSLTIRGMSTSVVNFTSPNIAEPLVSTYVDDVPLFVNLKLTDIARVEVLRGPQGTLYGSGSVGGTIRIIHNEPDPTATEVDLFTTVSGTAHANDPSASFDAIVNVPLSDRIAFRGSAGYEALSGFTNALSVAELTSQNQPVLADPADPLHSPPVFFEQKGIDRSDTWYARGAALWNVSDAAKLTLSYEHQTDHSDGFSEQRPGYYLSQTLYAQQPGTFNTDLASLDASVEFGFATLSSTSSYTHKSEDYEFDVTGLIESLAAFYGNYPRIISPVFETSRDQIYTEEIRLVSKDSGPWQWVAGGYFSHQDQALYEYELLDGFATWSQLPGSGMPPGCTVESVTCPYPTFGDVIQFYKDGIRPSLNPDPDLNYTYNRMFTFRDLASFGELSYHFTDTWQATAGARVFWQRYTQDLIQTLPECGVFCSASGTNPEGLTEADNEKAFRNHIFKLNTSYSIAPRTLLYLTWSEGFRHGGANALPTGSCYYCAPNSLLTYEPDTAKNTELGIKGSLGAASSYTVTVYDIDWRNPQIEAYTPAGFQYVTNGVSATSRGVETELALRIAEPLKLELGYSYTDAYLTASFARDYNALLGVSGDDLPNVSKQQVMAALEYSTPLGNHRELHARVDASYRSSFWTVLPHTPGAMDLPGFTLLNARAGVTFGGGWQVNAFIDNLTNKIAVTAVSYTPGPPHDGADFVNRPRTAGLQVSYSFKGR
jgi:iron complex outermembrane recepter protein